MAIHKWNVVHVESGKIVAEIDSELKPELPKGLDSNDYEVQDAGDIQAEIDQRVAESEADKATQAAVVAELDEIKRTISNEVAAISTLAEAKQALIKLAKLVVRRL